jgi:hypothetical protein
VDAQRPPAEPQRQVHDVHAEVAHHADRPAVARLALPVDRLGAVEVARVQERVLGLDDLPERARADVLVRELGAGEVGHLARAAGEDVRALGQRGDDAPRGREVDPERLLAHEVLAGRDRVEVELLVQVVRHGEVEHVQLRVLQQAPPVIGEHAHAGNALEPRARGLARVAHRVEPRRRGVVLERRPAPDRGGQLAAHQAAADDPDADEAHASEASACSGVAPSWTTAISARVIPAGFACWMTLRP